MLVERLGDEKETSRLERISQLSSNTKLILSYWCRCNNLYGLRFFEEGTEKTNLIGGDGQSLYSV